MKIKTSEKIFNEYPKICYAGVELASLKDIKKCNIYKNKRWVSIESEIEFLDKMEQDYKDINQHNDYVKRVIYDIKQKLKGEK